MNKLTLSIRTLLACGAFAAVSANAATDARSFAMGNTGVVAADYLTAPFHNPALGALYSEDDDFGLLIPAISINAHDPDETISLVEDSQDLYDEFEYNNNSQINRDLNDALDDLADNKPLNVYVNAGFSLAIPTSFVSLNLFAQGQVELAAKTEIAGNQGDSYDAIKNRYDTSEVEMYAFGVSEFGVALSKNFTIAGQNIAIGITPKMQELITYSLIEKIDDFEADDYDQSETSESAFNLDFGIAWHHEQYRAGLVIKNLMAQEIKTYDGLGSDVYTYELNPHATLGLGYVGELFTLSVDADLTTQTRFQEDYFTDDTQFVRAGLEMNAWGWAQLRAGYEMDLEDTYEDAITAGIGLSPFNLINIDLGASYGGENQLGGALNLAFTF